MEHLSRPVKKNLADENEVDALYFHELKKLMCRPMKCLASPGI